MKEALNLSEKLSLESQIMKHPIWKGANALWYSGLDPGILDWSVISMDLMTEFSSSAPDTCPEGEQCQGIILLVSSRSPE